MTADPAPGEGSGSGSVEVRPRLAAVFAHPDDESRITGGTLALAAAGGCRVSLYCATRGEAGDGSRPPAEVASLRASELRAACRVLGVTRLELRDFPDGGLGDVDERLVLDDLVRFLCDERPHVVLTFGPDGRSGHPDHVAIGRLAGHAVERAAEPVPDPRGRREAGPWQVPRLYHVAVASSTASRIGWRKQSLPDEALVRVDVTSTLGLKRRAAVEAHASQWALSPMNLSAGWETFAVEHFRLARHHGPPPGGDDLVAGAL